MTKFEDIGYHAMMRRKLNSLRSEEDIYFTDRQDLIQLIEWMGIALDKLDDFDLCEIFKILKEYHD